MSITTAGAINIGAPGQPNQVQIEPELHIIGEIVGGTFPGASTDNSFASFTIKHGSEWILVGGDELGQTQVDYPIGIDSSQFSVWNHPIDLHYYSRSISG